MKSIGTDRHEHRGEGDERIRTAVCVAPIHPVYEDAVCIRTEVHPVSCCECLACDVVHLSRRSCATCGLVYRGVVEGCPRDNCSARAAVARAGTDNT